MEFFFGIIFFNHIDLFFIIVSYHQFNFEELDMKEVIKNMIFFIFIIYSWYSYLDFSKINLIRKIVIREPFLGRYTEIPFDHIKGYKFDEGRSKISLFFKSGFSSIDIKKKKYNDDFLNWLKVNKPVQEDDELTDGNKIFLWFFIYVLFMIAVSMFEDPINDYVRYRFPFNPVETIEISGILISSSSRYHRGKGAYESKSIKYKGISRL